MQELITDSSDKQHRWRGWIVNTQTSRQQGSHWFTVVLGIQTQLLQSIATQDASDSCASQLATDCIASSSDTGTAPSSAHLPKSTAKLPDGRARPNFARASSPSELSHSTDGTNNYPNLFEIPDAATTDMINWAHANAMHQPVAALLRACGEWDPAMATKDHHRQQKRRKLCKDHDIPCTREIWSPKKLDVTMEHIRQELINRIQQIRATRKTFGNQVFRTVLTKRAVKMKNEAEPYVGSAATEHAETEKVGDHRPSVSIQEGRFADIASFMCPCNHSC